MSTMEQDVEEIVDELPDGMPDDSDSWFDWQMQKLAKISRRMEDNRQVFERWREWYESQNMRLARAAQHVQQRMHERALAYDFGDAKSRDLPAGTFGFRQHPARLEVIDKAAAVAACKELGIPVRVKPATEEPDAKAIKAHIKATGIEPDGCTLVPGIDEFYVDAASTSQGR